MANLNLSNVTTTGLKTAVKDFQVQPKTLDVASSEGETTWSNPNFKKYLGYYKTIPQLYTAVNSLAMWTTGKGWTTDHRTKAILDYITGWGEDNFDDIMFNHLVIKKINGDAYAEIIRDPETEQLINLKPLNPAMIETIVNSKGIITGYYELDHLGNKKRRMKKEQIFHSSNNRVGNEIHGTSIIEPCQWIIDALHEAMSDRRRILHRSSIRVIEVDADDTTTINRLKTEYHTAIRDGEVMLVPKGTIGFPDVPPMSTQDHDLWIRYLENYLHMSLNVPKVILGGSQEFTEASSKIGYLTFEQPYMTEQRGLEMDIWNQLNLKITFNRPASLQENVQSDEAANTGQLNIQPNATEAGVGK